MILASDSITVQGVEFAGPWMKGMPPDNAVAVYIDVYGATPSTRITVQDCRVHNFPFDGLWARNGTSQIHFRHNESYDNAWNAIEIEAQDSSVVDNDLHDNRGQGVEVLSAAQRVRVANNWAVRDAVGIKLINQNPPFGTISEISVVGNNTADNTQDGILYISTATGNPPSGLTTITGNTSVGNAHDGISLYQAGVGITVSDNVVSSNAYADISIEAVSDVVVSNNILTALPGAPRAANGILIAPDSVRIHVLNKAVDGY
jgi:parallel beta-helix repeat protein